MGAPCPTAQLCEHPKTGVWRHQQGWLFLFHLGTLVTLGNSSHPAGPSSPVQDPDLLGAGQGRSQLVSFVYYCGFLELLPGEVPLLLATQGNSVAVDSGPQVGVDSGWGGGSQQWSRSRQGGIRAW